MTKQCSFFAAALTLGFTALAALHCEAQTSKVVDISTRGVTQRFLYVRPDAPRATIVFLPGRDGHLGVEDDGSVPNRGALRAVLRHRDAFLARGFALAFVDRASDLKARQFTDIREVVRYVRSRDNVPTWIIGGSGSTMGALNFAVELPSDEPLGVVIFAVATILRGALVKRPTLVIYHRDDPGAAALPMKERVDSLFDSLTAAPMQERIELVGGTKMDECGGYHLFRGIDAELVAAIVGFIDKNNDPLRANR
jgi:hypothetical protein